MPDAPWLRRSGWSRHAMNCRRGDRVTHPLLWRSPCPPRVTLFVKDVVHEPFALLVRELVQSSPRCLASAMRRG